MAHVPRHPIYRATPFPANDSRLLQATDCSSVAQPLVTALRRFSLAPSLLGERPWLVPKRPALEIGSYLTEKMFSNVFAVYLIILELLVT
jgi:hypothetical protein